MTWSREKMPVEARKKKISIYIRPDLLSRLKSGVLSQAAQIEAALIQYFKQGEKND